MAVSQTIGGNPYISTNSSNPYQDIYNQYAAAQEKQKQADQEAWQQRRDTDLGKINANYDTTSKSNYLNYMQNQKALPSQLQRLGVNGGANESAQLRLSTAYGNNIASNEASRNSALASANNTYENEWNDYLINYNSNLASQLAQAQQNDVAYQRELAERDLSQFAASITGRFATRGEYATLIAQLRASNDPNKEYKIALAQQAMNNMAASSGGGGYGSSYYSGGGSGGNSTTLQNSSGVQKGASIGYQAVADALKTANNKGNKKSNNPKTNGNKLYYYQGTGYNTGKVKRK